MATYSDAYGAQWKDVGYSLKPVSFDPTWIEDKSMAAVKKTADDLTEAKEKSAEGTQIETFAVHHGITVAQAYKALNKSIYFEVKEQPEMVKHIHRHWPLLRKQAVDSGHALGPNGPCLVCLDEAEKNVPPPNPEKLKVYLSYLNDTSHMGTKADRDEAKIIRRQISAFAAIHSFNRYTALEHIKKCGELAEEHLLPYLFPLDKKSAVPDQYQLKTLDWPDLAAVLIRSKKWSCSCYNCASQMKTYTNFWLKGKKTNVLEVTAIRALFPDAPVNGSAPVVEVVEKNNPVDTLGPKNAECLMTLEELKFQISVFSAIHGLNRHATYFLLPDSWREKYSLAYSPDGKPVPLSQATDDQDKMFACGEIAAAIQCKCNLCKWAISKTPMKWKKAQTVKKITKKALLAKETTLEKALGEGLSSEHDFSINSIPLEKQALAYAAYHELAPIDVWDQKFPSDENPFSGDEECDISDLDFHIWPSLVDLNDCECGECKGQPVPEGETVAAPAVEAFSESAIAAPAMLWHVFDEVDDVKLKAFEAELFASIDIAEMNAKKKKKNLPSFTWSKNKNW